MDGFVGCRGLFEVVRQSSLRTLALVGYHYRRRLHGGILRWGCPSRSVFIGGLVWNTVSELQRSLQSFNFGVHRGLFKMAMQTTGQPF